MKCIMKIYSKSNPTLSKQIFVYWTVSIFSNPHFAWNWNISQTNGIMVYWHNNIKKIVIWNL